MKKILAYGLAAAVAAGAFSATTGAAVAKHWGYYPHPPQMFHSFKPRPRSGAYFFFGTPGFGLSFRAPGYRSYPFRPVLSAHAAWCLRAYPNTYNPATNTYHPKKGVTAFCVSPYGY